jgi:hypothetical protein
MTDAQPLRARGPADLLALVPGLLGFHPEQSVVLLTVGEAVTPFHARVDLPGDPVQIEEQAGYLADVAAHHGTTRVAVVVYSVDAGLAEAVVDELDRRLTRVRVELVCAVRADGERWWLAGGEPDVAGTPYDVRAHPFLAQAVAEGTVVHASRRELAATLDPQPELVATVARIGDEVMTRLGLAAESTGGRTALRRHLAIEARWVRCRVRRFLGDRRALDEHDLARLLVLLAVSTELRDVAWAEMSHDSAAAHVDLWRDAVRRAPEHLRAPAASLLGFAAWLSGDGALAWCAVERAQQAEPGYSMAGLLTQALAGAVPPSAWTPIPPGSLPLLGP